MESLEVPNSIVDFRFCKKSVAYEWRRRLLSPQTRLFPPGQHCTCADDEGKRRGTDGKRDRAYDQRCREITELGRIRMRIKYIECGWTNLRSQATAIGEESGTIITNYANYPGRKFAGRTVIGSSIYPPHFAEVFDSEGHRTHLLSELSINEV